MSDQMNRVIQTWEERAEALGRDAMESIAEMVAALECDYDRLEELNGTIDDLTEAEELNELQAAAGDCTSEDEARERIMDNPLSLLVRSGWYTPGNAEDDEMIPAEFELLLTTGGPAVRIVGELDYGQVKRPRLQVQDWYQSWTEYVPADKGVLRKYCGVFYFDD